MKKITLIILSLCIVGQSFAAIYPRSTGADSRVKIVNYDPNNIVVVKARYGYQTQIVFAPQEAVQNVSLGDSMAWQVNPVGNNLFLKPTASSKTNMTVLTNQNSYSFQLDSTQQNVNPTYKLAFIYPQGGFNAEGASNAIGHFDPSQLNWKYSFTGYRAIAPIEAFDNGQFTYFKFSQSGMSSLPAIFMVDDTGQETLVNYHVQGQYVIVNSVAKRFVLRNGNYITHVYNDTALGDWQKFS